jgi:ribosomal peptide maturation radical SAM protein 1
VGFTTNHAQLFSSLLIARWIKRDHPDALIVFGGKQVSGSIGESIVENFPQVDWCIDGEGEAALVELLRAIERGADEFEDKVPGLIHRLPTGTKRNSRRILKDLKGFEDPDYDHYFQVLENDKSLGETEIDPYLPLEASRGCAYRCAFCGDHGYWGPYRMRPAEETASSIKRMCTRYRVASVRLSDPMITPKCCDELFPILESHDRDYKIFCEVHAGLSKDRLSLMKRAGVSQVQIGIEALNTALLAKMNKGTRLIDNLEIMKFCEELGIKQNSHLIIGFPNEVQGEIDNSVRAIDMAYGYSPLRVVEFRLYSDSPVYNSPRKYGITSIDDVGRIGKRLPHGIASRLDLPYKSFRTKRKKRTYAALKKRISAWEDSYEKASSTGWPALCYFDCEGFLKIEDRRMDDRSVTLDGLARRIYLLCSSVKDMGEILDRFSGDDSTHIESILRELLRLGVMFNEGDSWLALAVRSDATSRNCMPFL